MPPTCPAGHDTASTEFCDVCGVRLRTPAPPRHARVAPAAAASDPPGPPCPHCGTSRSGLVCDTCGYDFVSGVAPRSFKAEPPDDAGPCASGTWMAVVTADRAYFDSVVAAGGPDADTVEFPAYCPERRFRLRGSTMRIGRRSASRGLEPEIDLTGPPADPAVSHLHAVLIAEPDGGWTVFDPGSVNGTLVNGREMAAGTRIRLYEGDRICVGAWTVLTICPA